MMMIEAGKKSNARNPGNIPPKRKQSKSDPAPHAGGIGNRILLVEDELLIAENMKEVIEEAGYKVVGIYPSAEDAIRNVTELKPDLIVMDVRLSGPLDGIQAARIIQQTIKAVPILFLTAHTKLKFPHLDYLNPNSYRYLNKPSTRTDLIDSIKKLLSQTDK